MKIAIAIILVFTMMAPISASAMTTTEIQDGNLPSYYTTTGGATYTVKNNDGELISGSMLASPKKIPTDIEAQILQNVQYRVSTKNRIDLSVQGKNKRTDIEITERYGYWDYLGPQPNYIFISNRVPLYEHTTDFEISLNNCFLEEPKLRPLIVLEYSDSESAARALIDISNRAYFYIQCAFTTINGNDIQIDMMENNVQMSYFPIIENGNKLVISLMGIQSITENGEKQYTAISYTPKYVFRYNTAVDKPTSVELVQPIQVDKSGTRLKYTEKSQSEKLIQFITDRRKQDWSIEYQEASTGFASFVIDTIDGFVSAEILPNTKLGDIILIPLVFILGFAIIRKIGT